MAKSYCIVLSMLILIGWGPLWGQTNDRRRFESGSFQQDDAIRSAVEAAFWKYRTFFATPILGLERVGYDSNVFGDQVNQVDDYFVAPEVGIQTYFRPNPRWIWSNKLTYNFLYYFDQEDLRGSQYVAESRLHGLFRKFYFNTGIASRKNLDTFNSEVEDRGFSSRQTFDLNLYFEPLPRLSMRLRTAYADFDLEEGARSFEERLAPLAREEWRSSALALYRWRPQIWPFLELQYEDFSFDRVDRGRQEAVIQGVLLGTRNRFNQRLHFSLALGQKRVEIEPEDAGDTRTLTIFRSFVGYRVTRRYQIQTGLERSPIFSIFSQYDYFVSSRLSFGVNYTTRRRIGLGPIIRLGDNDYLDVDPNFGIRRQDDLLEYGFNLILPGRKLSDLNLTFLYVERDSNFESQSDDGFQLVASIKPKVF